MKNIFTKSTLCLLFLALASSCLKYDELRENPNDPTEVAPSLLFTEVTPTPASSLSLIHI